MRTSNPVRVFVLALMLVALAPRIAPAAWPRSPGVNLPIVTASGVQLAPAVVSDRAGGAIIAWQDSRAGAYDLYAQRVLASGVADPSWTANGILVCNALNDQTAPVMVSDGANGAIVAWEDTRNITSIDVYAQHILASGIVDPAWPSNGRALCLNAADQRYPTITSDGSGGAIVGWADYRSGAADVYAQHVLSSGAVDAGWPVDGRAVCTAAGDQGLAQLISDGAGGAILTWPDLRGVNYDIYAQHLLASGAVDPFWPANGQALCAAINGQFNPAIAPDGAGGAIVAWQDGRGATIDIYAQHVFAYGPVDASWPINGRLVCGATIDQNTPAIVSDGAGGAIVTWQDFRSGSSYDIYAHHVLPSGAVDPGWPADGRALCTAAGGQYAPKIISDGSGGAIVTWYDLRSSATFDVYSHHVLAGGSVDPNWPADGRALCTASSDQQSPVLVSDGASGAIVTWQDLRSGTLDLYAQRVARFGYLGTPEAEIINVRDVPNDNGGKVKLSWYASYLDTDSDPNFSAYDVYRSVPPNVAKQAVRDGARLGRSFSDLPASRGRTIVISPARAEVYAWEYVATQNAQHFLPTYSLLAPTAGDSTSYQNPRTAFMVVARNASGSMYWLSRPDSGYSVDNLPPLAPQPFTGQYGAGVAHLHWDPNSESDLANYRLYRGTSSSFVPSPANRIAAPNDTGYADPAGAAYYYKLSAVDVHGNESGFTTLLPGGALDAPAGALPRDFALERPSPNPARDAVTLRYALPREARVTLAIYDAAGRQVRRMVSGTQPAGEHVARWDLRDEAGHPVGAGLFFVRLEAGSRTFARRMATLR